jgi:pSer/pThr/pTyr-binding forkhead associated (FHA) protein
LQAKKVCAILVITGAYGKKVDFVNLEAGWIKMSFGSSSTPVPATARKAGSNAPEVEITGLRPAEVEDKISTMAAVPQAHLVLEMVGEGEPRHISLVGELGIGRGSGNELRLPDPRLSRRHALIGVTDKGYLLQDMDSKNGTFVNGNRLGEPHLLQDGDVIRLGEVCLTFHLGKTSTPTPPSSPPPPAQPAVYLIVQPPRGSPQRFPVANEMRIGRRAGNNLRLDYPQVSRQHAVVTRTAEGYALHDLGSRNGTHLNGQLVVGRRLLEDGDVIEIGDLKITFKVEVPPHP